MSEALAVIFFVAATGVAGTAAVVGSAAAVTVNVGQRLGLVRGGLLPWEKSSRAARAERQGLLGNALHYYALAGRRKELPRTIKRHVPKSSARAALLAAIEALADIDQLGRRALNGGVPREIAMQVTEETRYAQAEVWEAANRIAAAIALGAKDSDFDEEVSRLRGLTEDIMAGKEALARLVLTIRPQVLRQWPMKRVADLAAGAAEARQESWA